MSGELTIGSTHPPEGWVGFSVDRVSRSLQTTLDELRSESPWIPGATFRANPGLAEYLAQCIEKWAVEHAG